MDTLNEALGLKIPQHVAVILDGNGRWAKQRHMPRTYGHKVGSKVVEDMLTVVDDLGVKIFYSVCIFNRKLEAFYGGGFNTDDHSAYIFKGLCQKNP